MDDDDDEVRGTPGPEELLGPTGPRRSSFTPAPNDAESLEAAANLFNDDAIAAALSAELARVASGPIPIQQPPVEQPEPASEAVPQPAAEPEPERAPEPVASAPASPVQPGPPDWATPLFGQPQPTEQAEPMQPPPPSSDPFAPSAPSFAPSNGPFPPPGDSPPEPAPPTFPVADAGAASLQTADPDALRALYAAAPAPTVPAADAPPPPGYAAPGATSGSPSVGSPGEPSDLRPRRRALDDDGSPRLNAIEELQAQLDQRDREAREYAAWESSMLEVGTPESLSAVEEARAERAGMPHAAPVATPAAPTEEPAALLPPPVEEPAVFLPPPVEEPAVFLPPPVEDPTVFLPPPVDEPAVFLPAPVEEPAAFLPPPATEPAAFPAPPADEPAAFLPPPFEDPAADFAPPTDEPAAPVTPPIEDPAAFLPPAFDESAADLAPLADESIGSAPSAADNPFDIFAASIDHPTDVVAPPSEAATPFPRFALPRDASTIDFAAPADPRELSFDQPPVPDSPVFLEPTLTASVPSAPSGPPSWNLDESASAPSAPAPFAAEPTPEERAAALPTDEERVAAGAPPALVEPPAPVGVADLWRTASQSEPSAPAPVTDAAPAPAPDVAPAQPSAEVPPEPPQSAKVAHGFDDLLSGLEMPDPQPPSSAWVAGAPNPFPDPAIDAATGDRRPFGGGVERDEAVDPSDSIFGAPPAPVSAHPAGVAAAPEYLVVESLPISVLTTVGALIVGAGPKIFSAERVGLEPTPVEQRVGRAARLFWLWFAANSSIAAIVFGTIIFALGVSLRQAIVATLAGVALSFLPLGLGTLAGKRSGQPTMVISRATFGVVGNILPSLIALFGRLFWAAALLWVLGAGTAAILTGAQLTDGFTTGQLTIIAMGIGFLLAVVVAYFGYGLIAKVQLVISVISGIAIVGSALRYAAGGYPGHAISTTGAAAATSPG